MAVEEITVDELAVRCAGGAFLLDVRQPEEFAEARVPGAVLIPLQELGSRLVELPDGDVVHVICRTGARSARAVAFLVEQGVDAVNVTGGTIAWMGSGHGVDSGAQGS